MGDVIEIVLAGLGPQGPPGPPLFNAFRPTINDGSVRVVPGMVAGAGWNESALLQFGVIGSRLCVFGDQNDPPNQPGGGAGALSGMWSYQDKVWTYLGQAISETPIFAGGNPNHNYNHMPEWGAQAYKGKLYLGDRHQGHLYRVDLNYDGSLDRIMPVARVGFEDLFLGPEFAGRLPIGTFGVIGTPTDYGGLFTYDGTTVTNIFYSPDCLNMGYVHSMAIHGGYLWVTCNAWDGNYFEMWRVDSTWAATRVWTGNTAHRLISNGPSLLAVEWRDSNTPIHGGPVNAPLDARWVVWRNNAWVRVSPDFGCAGLITAGVPQTPRISAVWQLGDRLFASSTTYGIYEFTEQVVSRITTSPPKIQSVRVHDGSVWLASVAPVELHQMEAPVQPARIPVGSFATPPSPGVTRVSSAPLAVTALPIANSAVRGHKLVLLGNGATPDTEWLCRRTSGDVYEWVQTTVGAGVIPLPTSRMMVHYDAESIIGLADGAAVGAGVWQDQSPNGLHLSLAGTGQTYHTNLLSGKPGVRFSGAAGASYLKTGVAAVPWGANTAFLVARWMALPTTAKYMMDGLSINGHGLYAVGAAGSMTWGMSGFSGMTSTLPIDTNWHIIVCTFGPPFKLRVDGGAGQVLAGAVSMSRTGIVFGAIGGFNTFNHAIEIAAYIEYFKLQTLDEINAVGTHMAAKYPVIPWTMAT